MNSIIYAVIPAYNPSLPLIALLNSLAAMPFKGIILVDDGSAPGCASVFAEACRIPGVTLLRHAVNLGKGQALKTAFNHLLLEHADMHGVVTADADGQHLPEDILKVAHALEREERALVLGVRTFKKNVPLRSRFGNVLTAGIARGLLGRKIQDTQTGLRGISRELLPELIRLRTGGYDYEMEMLICLLNSQAKLLQVDISTVYVGKNETSHFNPLLDSVAIYYVFIRHIGNSIITAILDFSIFSICYYFSDWLLLSIAWGRIFAGAFNFSIGKAFVFKSNSNIVRELISYIWLVIVLMLISYSSIRVATMLFNMSPYWAKFIVELIIFILSFSVQRIFIFSRSNKLDYDLHTDWDNYYINRTISQSTVTRRITGRLIVKKIKEYEPSKPQTIVEFGGGDSCFYEKFRESFPGVKYIVIDNSTVGVEKFREKAGSGAEAVCWNILEPFDEWLGDIVYSVGLIEHFAPDQTAACIRSHFQAVRPGGIVLLSYPSPTALYRAIRFVAEWLKIWRFVDERPLLYAEVSEEVCKYGSVLWRGMNWGIGLTQEIVIARRS
jgi:SAM-dependent methyltransferase